MVCYNYESLENIKNHGIQNILYSFNDYFYFAKTDVFFKLNNLFDDCCFYHPNNPDLYNHYFCPESQFIIFCLNLEKFKLQHFDSNDSHYLHI
jgi:hypothetical protein